MKLKFDKFLIKSCGKQVVEQVMWHFNSPTKTTNENDLQSRNPQQIADNIVDLDRNIESNSKAEVLISELITRRDQNAQGVDATNKSLRRYCSQNGWKLIRHNNISQPGLNKGGLHLNQVGNETFF